MKKNMLSTLILLSSATLLVLSYLSGTTDASAVNRYEHGSKQYEQEVYYNQEEINTETTVNETVYMFHGSDTPLAGIALYNLGSLGEDDIGITTVKMKKTKKVKAKEVKQLELKNRWNVVLTNDEIDLLAKIVWIESRGESNRGQRGVIEVVFNRMIHNEFKGTLYEVLSQKGQFCSWSDRNNADPTDKEYKNIRKVLEGKTDILDFNTVYFSTSPRNNDISAHIGGHYFCRY
jgi:hypothetical protein